MVSVTSPSEQVSIGVRASWLGFVGGLFPRFCLTFVSVLGFPHVLSPVWVALSGSCPGSISTLIPTWLFFLLGHSMELCREVGGTHLWVLAVASLLVAVQFVACCDGVWIDTSHLHIVRTTTTTTTTRRLTQARVSFLCNRDVSKPSGWPSC